MNARALHCLAHHAMDTRYQLLEKIVQGERSQIWRARDALTGKQVAVKRPTPKLFSHAQNEIKALQQITTPNSHVVRLVSSGEDQESPYLVLNWLEGETLEAIIQSGPLPFHLVHAVAEQALTALMAVHSAGLIHRDVKPDNLMILWPNKKDTINLTLFDFDLAQPVGKPCTDGCTGSIHFMAPELFEHGSPDPRTDLYALGVALYYTLTAHHPFEGETKPQVITSHLRHDVIPPTQLRPDIPPIFAEWLERLISRDAAARPATAAQALSLLSAHQLP